MVLLHNVHLLWWLCDFNASCKKFVVNEMWNDCLIYHLFSIINRVKCDKVCFLQEWALQSKILVDSHWELFNYSSKKKKKNFLRQDEIFFIKCLFKNLKNNDPSLMCPQEKCITVFSRKNIYREAHACGHVARASPCVERWWGCKGSDEKTY